MEKGQNVKTGSGGLTIVYQILITMLITALIPIGGLWYISIYKAREDWTANIYQALVANTENLSQRVDEWATMNLRVLDQNSLVSDMQSMEGSRQSMVLKTITDTYKWIYLAFTIGPDGENIGRSDGEAPKFYGDRDYFKDVMAGGEMGQQVLMGKTSGKPAFILSKPIGQNGDKPAGVIAIAMTLEELSATITRTRIGKTGFAILVDEQNRLIAHGKGEIENKLQDMGGHPLVAAGVKPDPDNFTFDYEGKKIVAYTAATKLGWKLIVQQDANEAYSAAQKARTNAFILLCATLAIVLVVATLLARRLSQPIRNLTLIADEISKGKLGAKIDECSRSDEIGALARAIERMGVSLQMAIDRLRKTK